MMMAIFYLYLVCLCIIIVIFLTGAAMSTFEYMEQAGVFNHAKPWLQGVLASVWAKIRTFFEKVGSFFGLVKDKPIVGLLNPRSKDHLGVGQILSSDGECV